MMYDPASAAAIPTQTVNGVNVGAARITVPDPLPADLGVEIPEDVLRIFSRSSLSVYITVLPSTSRTVWLCGFSPALAPQVKSTRCNLGVTVVGGRPDPNHAAPGHHSSRHNLSIEAIAASVPVLLFAENICTHFLRFGSCGAPGCAYTHRSELQIKTLCASRFVQMKKMPKADVEEMVRQVLREEGQDPTKLFRGFHPSFELYDTSNDPTYQARMAMDAELQASDTTLGAERALVCETGAAAVGGVRRYRGAATDNEPGLLDADLIGGGGGGDVAEMQRRHRERMAQRARIVTAANSLYNMASSALEEKRKHDAAVAAAAAAAKPGTAVVAPPKEPPFLPRSVLVWRKMPIPPTMKPLPIEIVEAELAQAAAAGVVSASDRLAALRASAAAARHGGAAAAAAAASAAGGGGGYAPRPMGMAPSSASSAGSGGPSSWRPSTGQPYSASPSVVDPRLGGAPAAGMHSGGMGAPALSTASTTMTAATPASLAGGSSSNAAGNVFGML